MSSLSQPAKLFQGLNGLRESRHGTWVNWKIVMHVWIVHLSDGDSGGAELFSVCNAFIAQRVVFCSGHKCRRQRWYAFKPQG